VQGVGSRAPSGQAVPGPSNWQTRRRPPARSAKDLGVPGNSQQRRTKAAPVESPRGTDTSQESEKADGGKAAGALFQKTIHLTTSPPIECTLQDWAAMVPARVGQIMAPEGGGGKGAPGLPSAEFRGMGTGLPVRPARENGGLLPAHTVTRGNQTPGFAANSVHQPIPATPKPVVCFDRPTDRTAPGAVPRGTVQGPPAQPPVAAGGMSGEVWGEGNTGAGAAEALTDVQCIGQLYRDHGLAQTADGCAIR